jgi:type VI protein secretion system component Hcp
MARNVALRFVFFIGLGCALAGANPAHAGFIDYPTLYSQVQLLVNGFTERASQANFAREGFLQLDDVKGSATNATYKDQIPVLYSQNFIAVFGGSISGAGKASPSDYFLVIPVDQSGPILEQAAGTGRPFQKATITNLRPDRGLFVPFHTDTLESVQVTFYMKTSTAVPAFPEVAIIGLSFGKATWAFGAVKACRDFASNQNC